MMNMNELLSTITVRISMIIIKYKTENFNLCICTTRERPTVTYGVLNDIKRERE